jgi:hypothetical protein
MVYNIYNIDFAEQKSHRRFMRVYLKLSGFMYYKIMRLALIKLLPEILYSLFILLSIICWNVSSLFHGVTRGRLEPVQALSILPLSNFGLFFTGNVRSFAVLFSILPLSVVLSTIGPFENSVALFLIVNVFSFVSTSIGPLKDSISVHLVQVPFSCVLTTVSPCVNSVAVDVVVYEFSFIS